MGISGPGGHDISADGRIVVGGDWRWVEGRGFERIIPPQYRGTAFTVSGDGRIVGGVYHRSREDWDLEPWAFIWREGIGFEDLTQKYAGLLSEGAQLEEVHDISADGRYLLVVGTRPNPRWGRDGFIGIIDTRVTGDVDGNECVDDGDLLRVLFAFGQVGSGLPEDVDEDGMVWDSDLVLVLQHFGRGCR